VGAGVIFGDDRRRHGRYPGPVRAKHAFAEIAQRCGVDATRLEGGTKLGLLVSIEAAVAAPTIVAPSKAPTSRASGAAGFGEERAS